MDEKKVDHLAHLMDRMANRRNHGSWFTLVKNLPINNFRVQSLGPCDLTPTSGLIGDEVVEVVFK